MGLPILALTIGTSYLVTTSYRASFTAYYSSAKYYLHIIPCIQLKIFHLKGWKSHIPMHRRGLDLHIFSCWWVVHISYQSWLTLLEGHILRWGCYYYFGYLTWFRKPCSQMQTNKSNGIAKTKTRKESHPLLQKITYPLCHGCYLCYGFPHLSRTNIFNGFINAFAPSLTYIAFNLNKWYHCEATNELN